MATATTKSVDFSSLSGLPQAKRTESSGVIVFGTSFEVGPNYEIVSPIGQGAYGVVVAAKVKNMEAL